MDQRDGWSNMNINEVPRVAPCSRNQQLMKAGGARSADNNEDNYLDNGHYGEEGGGDIGTRNVPMDFRR